MDTQVILPVNERMLQIFRKTVEHDPRAEFFSLGLCAIPQLKRKYTENQSR